MIREILVIRVNPCDKDNPWDKGYPCDKGIPLGQGKVTRASSL